MKVNASLIIVLLTFLAAPANAAPTPEQRALAERITSRITEGLEAEPFTVEPSCDGDDCTISIYQ